MSLVYYFFGGHSVEAYYTVSQKTRQLAYYFFWDTVYIHVCDHATACNVRFNAYIDSTPSYNQFEVRESRLRPHCPHKNSNIL